MLLLFIILNEILQFSIERMLFLGGHHSFHWFESTIWKFYPFIIWLFRIWSRWYPNLIDSLYTISTSIMLYIGYHNTKCALCLNEVDQLMCIAGLSNLNCRFRMCFSAYKRDELLLKISESLNNFVWVSNLSPLTIWYIVDALNSNEL